MNLTRNLRKNLIASLCLAALVGTGDRLFAQSQPPAAKDNEPADVASRPRQSNQLTALGTLEPTETLRLNAGVGGVIAKWVADSGDTVKAGDLLAIIDPVPYQVNLKRAQAGLASASAVLDRAKSDLEFASMSSQRGEMNFKSGTLGAADFDALRHQRELAVAAVEIAKADVLAQQASCEQAKLQFSQTNIISPIDGVILDRRVTVGQTVSAGASPEGLFVIASDLKILKVRIAVPAAEFRSVAAGQIVRLTVNGIPQQIFTGKITRIQFSPEAMQQTGTFTVIAMISNSDHELIPYLSVNAQIELGHRSVEPK